MHSPTEKKPKIFVMGEEVPYDDFPGNPHAVELADYFKPVRLTPHAINEASKIVPYEMWAKRGICKWLQERADYVHSKMSTDQREAKLKSARYIFEYDSAGAVLVDFKLG